MSVEKLCKLYKVCKTNEAKDKDAERAQRSLRNVQELNSIRKQLRNRECEQQMCECVDAYTKTKECKAVCNRKLGKRKEIKAERSVR